MAQMVTKSSFATVRKFQWEPRYSVGHPLLDEQHKNLLNLCAKAAACLEDDSEEGREQFLGLLNDMSVFVKHFRTEENILAAHACPQVLQHREEHLEFIEKLTDFLTAAAQGRLEKADVYAFLTSWWRHHVLGSDMQFKPFLSAKQPTANQAAASNKPGTRRGPSGRLSNR